MAGNGSRDLAALAVRLKATGRRDLRLQLLRGLKAGAKPLIAEVHDAALAKLPKHGGLNARVAGQKVSVSVRTGPRTAGVRLTTKAPDTAQTDQGYVRHPVFGRRTGKWPDQPIPGATGWWSQTLSDAAPKVTPHMLVVLETVAAEIRGI